MLTKKPAFELAFLRQDETQVPHIFGASHQDGANPFCIQTKVAHNLPRIRNKCALSAGTFIAKHLYLIFYSFLRHS
jgi:hypothetical protein